ncbi:PIN domain-containing protein [Streptomyces sp. NPDC097619]|uniref:type II toxin-antitoxin system VapC family toxin n=1 Tax=Streptomyces sp. NPDC097619 TaxID=3157228 RepID=UPI0033211E3B
MRLVCDTGPLLAVANAKDAHHEACTRLFAGYSGEVLVPSPVLPEVCHLLQTRVGAHAEVAFIGAVARRELTVVDPTAEDWVRIAELAGRYMDLPLGLADAAVVAVSERLGVTTVATVDRKHFRIVRPRHCTAFDLVPD